jgi:hypothetical protein
MLRRHRLTRHTSARFRGRAHRQASGPVSGQLYERPPTGRTGDKRFRFPAAFRLPAFASWASCSRHGIPPPSRLAYHHTIDVVDRTGFPRSARMRYDRVGCQLYPGSSGVHTTANRPRPPLADSQRPAPHHPHHHHPTWGVAVTRHRHWFAHAHPFGLPLTCDTRSERAPLGFPLGFAPGHH